MPLVDGTLSGLFSAPRRAGNFSPTPSATMPPQGDCLAGRAMNTPGRGLAHFSAKAPQAGYAFVCIGRFPHKGAARAMGTCLGMVDRLDGPAALEHASPPMPQQARRRDAEKEARRFIGFSPIAGLLYCCRRIHRRPHDKLPRIRHRRLISHGRHEYFSMYRHYYDDDIFILLHETSTKCQSRSFPRRMPSMQRKLAMNRTPIES